MKATPRSSRFVLGALLAGLMIASTAAMAPPPHFDLAKSSPADEATAHMVHQVTLWFTEVPSEGSVSIRLVDGTGDPIEGLSAVADEEDGTIFNMAIPDGLAAGAYKVSWRGMGPDGHVVRGDFGFTVASH